MAPHSHDGSNTVHAEINSEDSHNSNMWKGLVAMMGLIMFFFMEKALSMISEWRKYRQRKNKVFVLIVCIINYIKHFKDILANKLNLNSFSIYFLLKIHVLTILFNVN